MPETVESSRLRLIMHTSCFGIDFEKSYNKTA